MTTAIREFAAALLRWRLWTAFAWEDLKTTYRRSSIGILWISLSFTLFVGVKILIFGMVIGHSEESYYSIYVILGFFAWQFMFQIMQTGPSVFTSNENWIRNDPIELPIFVFQSVTRSMFDLGLTGLVVIAALLIFGFGATMWTLLAIPALTLYVLNAMWVVLLLGVICTRYRDVTHLNLAMMRVLFFLTPIVWLPDQISDSVMNVLWWNPFSHFIWILRSPIIDQELAIESWIYVGVFTIAGWFVALATFARFRKRIVFWF